MSQRSKRFDGICIVHVSGNMETWGLRQAPVRPLSSGVSQRRPLAHGRPAPEAPSDQLPLGGNGEGNTWDASVVRLVVIAFQQVGRDHLGIMA